MRKWGVAIATLLVLSCADQTAPLRPGHFAVAPTFQSHAAGIVPVAAGRFVVRRLPEGNEVANEVRDIPPDADEIDLTLTVPLTTQSDSFALFVALVNATGDTVFRAGPVTVHPVSSGTPPLIDVPLTYVGLGSDAATVEITAGPAGLVAGQTGDFQAVARTAAGDIIAGTPIAWRALEPAMLSFADPGVGTALANHQRGSARVVAELLTGPADTASVSVTLPPSSIVAESGGGQTGPAASVLPTPLVARVIASDGVGVAGVTVDFAATLGGGSVEPPAGTTDETGRVSATFTLGNLVGAQTATATTPALPGASAGFTATSTGVGQNVMTVFAGNLQSALFNTAVGTDPAVRVTDGQTNPVPGVDVTFAVEQGGGQLTGAVVTTDANGVAAVGSWILGPLAGLNSLSATATDVTPVQFLALATAANGATSMTINAGDGQSALAGTAVDVPPEVLLRDTAGAVIAGVSVDFAVAAGGGGVTGTPAVSGLTGTAAVGVWTLGAVGLNQLTASAPGLPSLTFNATGTVGAAASVMIISGNNQTGQAANALAQPLVVEVQDDAGNPVPSVSLDWNAVHGTMNPPNGMTDATGRAQTQWTLGTNAVTQTATAVVSGLTPAVFGATATFPNPTVLLAIQGATRIAVGAQATLGVTLTAPAPAGGTVVTVSSDNTALVTVEPPGTTTIPEGQTTGTVVLNGVTSGSTLVRGNAAGFTEGTLGVTVSVQVLSMPTTLNVPFGQNASIPVQISTPAPPGGTAVTLVSSDPGLVEVSTPTVLIPEGAQTANGTLIGVFPGTTIVTGTTDDFGTTQSTVSTTASLNVVEAALTINATFGGAVTVRLESAGIPIAAPSPGILVDLSPVDPTCVVTAAQTTIPTGLVSVSVPVSYGGGAALTCASRVRASAPNIAADSVNVTVNPAPAITITNVTVGAGLQDGTTGNLGAPAPAGTVVRVSSLDPSLALVAPDISTPGTAFIDLPITTGNTSFSYVVQALDGQTGAGGITAASPLFTTGNATATVVPPALDIIFLGTSTTTLTASDPFQIRTGTANGQLTAINDEQELRAGAPPITVTITTSDAAVATLVTQAVTGPAVTTTVTATLARSPSTVATGGVELDPLTAGSVTISATSPGFVVLPSASQAVTVSAPLLTMGSSTVGSGLQDPTSVTFGAAAPAGTVVRVTSSDPSIALVSPDAATPGTEFVDLTPATGAGSVGVFVQGVEGQTGAVTLTATAPGYVDDTGIGTVVAPALDIIFLSATTTTLTASDVFQVRIGVPNGQLTAMADEQELRAGGTPAVVTLTTTDAAVAALVGQTDTGATVNTTVAVGLARSPGTVATGGVELDPLTAGAVTVSATIPGFVALPTASQAVTVSAPAITLTNVTVGAGLQRTTSLSLGAPAPAGLVVRVTSGDPAVAVVAPDASTPGTEFIDLPINPGASSVGYYVQGVESQTGAVTITATAPAYTGDDMVATVVAPALDIIFLNAATTTLTANDPFQLRLGVPNGQLTAMADEQELRAGAPGVTASITSSSPGVGQLVTQAVTGGAVSVPVGPGLARSPGTVGTGGVDFDPLTAGVTTVSAVIPGFVVLPSASVAVTVTTPGITLNAVTVGNGLQRNTSGSLGAPAPAAGTVRISSSNPGVALVSPDAGTAGTEFIDLPINAGAGSFTYYVQGVDGALGTVSVTANLSGYTDGSTTATIVAAALDIIFLNTPVAAGAADDPFQIRLGIANGTGTAMADEQERRAGAPALVATITNGTPATGQLVQQAGPASPAVVTIAAGLGRSPASVALGGVAFDPLAVGTTLVGATIPGLLALPTARVLVTVNP